MRRLPAAGVFGGPVSAAFGNRYSYALGARGKTKRKISEASGCLMEYIGMVAYLVGSAEERERCNTYLGWLLGQRGDSKETAKAVDITGRSDVDELACPQSYIGCECMRSCIPQSPFAPPSSTAPHRACVCACADIVWPWHA